MLRRLRSGAGLLLDWVLPLACAGCERPLPPGGGIGAARFASLPRGWCAGCAIALPGLETARCEACGEALDAAASGARQATSTGDCCARCQACPPAFDRTIVLGDYAPPLDHLIQAIKFGGQSALAAPLGRMLARAVRRACTGTDRHPDVLVPIPLTPARLAGRGFNQSLLLARPVARGLGLRLAPEAIQRVRQGAPASSLRASQRRGALEQAFVVRGLPSGAIVLVVDDVMTTGATLQAAASALKAAGAGAVVNCVAARTAPPADPHIARSGGPRTARPADPQPADAAERLPRHETAC